MDRLLARMERRFGRLSIPNLPLIIVGCMAAVFVLSTTRADFLALLTLDLDRVAHGEVWRLVTFLFLPRGDSVVMLIFALWWMWFIGSNLENEWGAFKFNVYYLLGALATIAAAFITGAPIGNFWLNLSLTFAFATLFPETEVLLLFIPMKVKWLGLISFAYVLWSFLTGSWSVRAAIVAALSNYLIFFGPHLVALLRSRNLQTRQAARRAAAPVHAGPVLGQRTCALCGAEETEGADIRVCSCEKCKPSRNLCVEHARNH